VVLSRAGRKGGEYRRVVSAQPRRSLWTSCGARRPRTRRQRAQDYHRSEPGGENPRLAGQAGRVHAIRRRRPGRAGHMRSGGAGQAGRATCDPGGAGQAGRATCDPGGAGQAGRATCDPAAPARPGGPHATTAVPARPGGPHAIRRRRPGRAGDMRPRRCRPGRAGDMRVGRSDTRILPSGVLANGKANPRVEGKRVRQTPFVAIAQSV